jgi:hypothetical protein
MCCLGASFSVYSVVFLSGSQWNLHTRWSVLFFLVHHLSYGEVGTKVGDRLLNSIVTGDRTEH